MCRPYGPHPPRFARHLPLKGKACGRPKAAPTAENGPGTLVRRRQAQKRNRTSSNFLPAQAPSGAGRNRAQALLILRAGNVLLTSRGNPRIRGPGPTPPVRGRCRVATEGIGWATRSTGTVLLWSRPRRRFAQSLVAPGEAQRSGFAGKRRSKGTNAVFAARRKRSGVDFATTSRRGQSHSPPAGGETPLRKEPSSGPMRASGPTKKRSIIAPSSVTASPCHLPPKGKAFKGSPLIRPLRGHLSLSPLSLRDIIPTPFGLRPFPPDRGNRPLDKGSRPPRGKALERLLPRALKETATPLSKKKRRCHPCP